MSALLTMSMTHIPTSATTEESRIKNIALFMVAPIIGLVYAMLFPFFAIGTLAWIGGKALIESVTLKAAMKHAKKLAMIAAAPAVGLLFVTALPVAGFAGMVWLGVHGAGPAGLAA